MIKNRIVTCKKCIFWYETRYKQSFAPDRCKTHCLHGNYLWRYIYLMFAKFFSKKDVGSQKMWQGKDRNVMLNKTFSIGSLIFIKFLTLHIIF